MGNCFDKYWGRREIKRLDKSRTEVGQQFAVLVDEHDKAINANEQRKTELQLAQVQLVRQIRLNQKNRSSTELSRREKQQVQRLLREMVQVEKRLVTAHAERASVTQSRDTITMAMTHHTTNKVKHRVYARASAQAGLNLDDMEKTRDSIDEADVNLSEIVGAMNSRSIDESEREDDSDLMAELMGGFMDALSGEQTIRFPQQDTAIGMVDEDPESGLLNGRRPGPSSAPLPFVLANGANNDLLLA